MRPIRKVWLTVVARTPDGWIDRIRTHVANNPGWGPQRIEQELAAEAGNDAAHVPSYRTIRRRRTEALAMSPEELMPYRYVRWPESFGSAAGLSWESARAVLDEIAFFYMYGGKRITVRWARWFWKLRQSTPVELGSEAGGQIRAAASVLSAMEILGGPTPRALQALEGWLAFRGFDEAEDDSKIRGRAAYKRAVRAGVVPEWAFELPNPVDGDDPQSLEALGELWGLSSERTSETVRLTEEFWSDPEWSPSAHGGFVRTRGER